MFLKQSVTCVCLFLGMIGTEFDYTIQYNQFRVILHAVDSLNVKYELQFKKIKQFCIMQTFPNDIFLVCHLKIMFYFLHELKQRSRSSDATGRH